jgi:two-component system, OmpR family, sensor kinase
MTIRLRLTLWYTTVLIATMIALGAALYLVISYELYGNAKGELQSLNQEVVKKARVVSYMSPQGVVRAIQLPRLDAFQSHVFLQAIDSNGLIAERSSNLGLSELPVDLAIMEKVKNEQKPLYEQIDVGEITLLVLNAPLVVQGGQYAGMLQVGTSVSQIESYLSSFKLIFLMFSLMLVLFAFSVGWFLARKALHPIEHVIAAAEQIEHSADLDKRIIYEGPTDEIGRLTQTINGMLVRIQTMYQELEEAYRNQRRFVSDASHELRTPLTTIRGNVDLLEKVWKKTAEDNTLAAPEQVHLSMEAMQDIAAEAERMSRLVNDLLSLARADAGQQIQIEEVEIRPILEEVSRKAQFLQRSADWVVGDMSTLDGVTVFGNRDYLQQLLFIFIDNAFKYTPSGEVRLEARQEGNQVGIAIADTGIGMDKDQVPHIFERFYRADTSRGRTSGTGLGLSIAKWIIDEHHGSIEVKTKQNAGTTFVLWIPAASARFSE